MTKWAPEECTYTNFEVPICTYNKSIICWKILQREQKENNHKQVYKQNEMYNQIYKEQSV